MQNDEDLMGEDLVETQETAGFHEAPQRLAIGGHFNHLFLWSLLKGKHGDFTDKDSLAKPSGKLDAMIEKYFTDYQGFKQVFKKAVLGRVLPGWVWLGCGKEGHLVITQTNNEDNPLMHGVAEVQCTPVIGIDMWEHAYFVQYKGDKEMYCDAFLDSINWDKVSAHFEQYNLHGKVAPLLD